MFLIPLVQEEMIWLSDFFFFFFFFQFGSVQPLSAVSTGRNPRWEKGKRGGRREIYFLENPLKITLQKYLKTT